MNSFLAKLTDTADFTKADRKIADFLMQHYQNVLNMTADEIGHATKTSGAAVIRFAKKLGYDGLPKLKLDLASNVDDLDLGNLSEIDKGETVTTIYSKIGTRFKLIPDNIQRRNSPSVIEKVVEWLEGAGTIFVYGISASSLVAQDLQQKFTRIGLTVFFNPDFHQMVTTLQAMAKPSDISFCISDSGATPEIVLYQKISSELGLKTIGMTSVADSKLAEKADLTLLSYAQEFTNVRYAATTGLWSQLYLVDVVFYTYLSQNFDEGIEHVLDTRYRVDQELRNRKL